MLNRPHDRRRYGRVYFSPPLPGMVDTTQVSIVEVSIIGARVVQKGRIAGSGTHRLRFERDNRVVEYSCEIARTTVARLAKKLGETTLYETALRLREPYEDSAQTLRDLISERVVQAINEQIANARGIPPLAVQSYQAARSDRYRRCEFVNGAWRRSDTTKPNQPDNGFTISADIDPYYIEELCRTYEACDAKGRELTRLFAQLSIDGQERDALRRYLP